MGLIQNQEDVRRPAVGLIQNQEDVSEIGGAEDAYSQPENSVGWVNTPDKRQKSWDSDSSGDYVVMSIKSRKETELKVDGARLPIKINGRQTNVWIDNGSPISTFTVGELKRTLDTAGVNVKAPIPGDDERITRDERMGDRSKNQADRRKQTVDYWERSNAKSGITNSAKDTGGKGDVSSRRTTGGRNAKQGGLIRPMADLFQ